MIEPSDSEQAGWHHATACYVRDLQAENEALKARVAVLEGAEIERLLFRIRRTSEMSANIMRDARRTGGWEGSEKTARQFDRLAKYAAQAEALAPTGDA